MSLSSLAKAQRWMGLSLTEMEKLGGGELAANGRLGNIKKLHIGQVTFDMPVRHPPTDVEQAVRG